MTAGYRETSTRERADGEAEMGPEKKNLTT